MDTSRICAAPACSAPLVSRRAHTKTCSASCRKRLQRQRAVDSHAHPHRDSAQWVQMRKEIAEYPGRHWAASESTGYDDFDIARVRSRKVAYTTGDWDRQLRRERLEYGTSYR